jgi:predicted enzyme related to lactoylglutathione lyase
MDATTNALNWFEIPATDIARAKRFYEAIFDIEMQQIEMMGMKMAMFPTDAMGGKVGGGLCQSDMHQPSTDGAVIYLNGNPDLTTMLNKVERAGGQVVMPKTHIDEDTGYMAFFIDPEGNKVGLHSNG